MKTKNNYTVVSEYGTFTRSTNNTYAYVVISCGKPEDHIRAQHATQLASDTKHANYNTEGAQVAAATGFAASGRDEYSPWVSVASEGQNPNTRCFGHKVEDIRKWADDYTAKVAAAPEQLATALQVGADLVANKKGTALAWSSRLDLALREAAKWSKFGYLTYVIEVVTGKVVA